MNKIELIKLVVVAVGFLGIRCGLYEIKKELQKLREKEADNA